jgi:hypothetical protein
MYHCTRKGQREVSGKRKLLCHLPHYCATYTHNSNSCVNVLRFISTQNVAVSLLKPIGSTNPFFSCSILSLLDVGVTV